MYDHDTNIVYMVGRGDTAIKSVEVGENPVFTEGAPTYTKSSLMGAALTPKRCLNVMEGEIARVQCLTNEGLIPGLLALVCECRLSTNSLVQCST